MPTDHELLDAWRSGDRRAGRMLFDRYFPAIHRFFNNKVTIGVDDLVQQTFLACTEGRERFRGEGSFRSWLFGIAHNVLLTHLRARYGEHDSALKSAFDLGPSPSNVLADKAEQRLLLEGLRRIPLDAQIVLELRFWEHMTGPEIAEVLGIPVGTVRTRLRRGQIELERQLKRLASTAALAESTLDRMEEWAASIREIVRRDHPDAPED